MAGIALKVVTRTVQCERFKHGRQVLFGDRLILGRAEFAIYISLNEVCGFVTGRAFGVYSDAFGVWSEESVRVGALVVFGHERDMLLMPIL